MIFENGIIYSTKLKQCKELIHGISARAFGNQSFLNGKVSEEKTARNRKNFLSWLKIDLGRIVNIQLIHGNNIYDVKESDVGKGSKSGANLIPKTDGLITNILNIYLMVTVADCLPILFYEPSKKVVGIAHVGWHGTWQKISEAMVIKMTHRYGCHPENIISFIGPSIGPCHYEVKEDVASNFKEDFLVRREDKIFLDLWQANKYQLIRQGLKEENIELSHECTACHTYLYSSYRLEGETKYIAMAAVIGLRK